MKRSENLSAETHEATIQYFLPIHQWNEADRPREKLIKQGARALSDAELIGLIFGSGTYTKDGTLSAIDLGKTLLREFGNLRKMSKRDLREMKRIKGIGDAKAVQLVAAFEIGRRIEAQDDGERIQITSPADVARLYASKLRDLPHEVFQVVLLNTANIIIGDYLASEGGLSASVVDMRKVFSRAILENAASMVCLHNHPSGNLEPSREDIAITKQLVAAGKVVGIPVHDHLIIAGRGYTSLAERGLMS